VRHACGQTATRLAVAVEQLVSTDAHARLPRGGLQGLTKSTLPDENMTSRRARLMTGEAEAGAIMRVARRQRRHQRSAGPRPWTQARPHLVTETTSSGRHRRLGYRDPAAPSRVGAASPAGATASAESELRGQERTRAGFERAARRAGFSARAMWARRPTPSIVASIHRPARPSEPGGDSNRPRDERRARGRQGQSLARRGRSPPETGKTRWHPD